MALRRVLPRREHERVSMTFEVILRERLKRVVGAREHPAKWHSMNVDRIQKAQMFKRAALRPVH